MINLKKRLRLIYVKWLVWRGKAVDIGSNGAYPAGVLSNITPYTFSSRGTDFVSMEALLQGLNSDLINRHGYTMDELKEIMEANNKQRFEFSEDMTRIRAMQGHSVHVDVELEEKLPPDVLYHGTGEQSLASIMEHGINKGNRLYTSVRDQRDCCKCWETSWEPCCAGR